MGKRRNRKVGKKTIVGDVTSMLQSDGISDHAIDWLVSGSYAWLWSQNYAEQGTKGKYEKCQYWTKAAKDKWIEIEKTGKRPGGRDFTHEHVVPRKNLVSKLLKLRQDCRSLPPKELAEKVERLFTENCLACVVLKAEDTLLPRELAEDADFIWDRYLKRSTIEVGIIENTEPNKWRALSLLSFPSPSPKPTVAG